MRLSPLQRHLGTAAKRVEGRDGPWATFLISLWIYMVGSRVCACIHCQEDHPETLEGTILHVRNVKGGSLTGISVCSPTFPRIPLSVSSIGHSAQNQSVKDECKNPKLNSNNLLPRPIVRICDPCGHNPSHTTDC